MSIQADLNSRKKIVIRGVKGMDSRFFKKTFRDLAAYELWADSEEAGNYEVQSIENA